MLTQARTQAFGLLMMALTGMTFNLGAVSESVKVQHGGSYSTHGTAIHGRSTAEARGSMDPRMSSYGIRSWDRE